MALIRFILRHTVELAAVESLALWLALCALTCLIVDRLFSRDGERQDGDKAEARRELAARGLRPFVVVLVVGFGLVAIRERR